MQLFCPACAKSTEHRHLFVKNQCDISRCSACGLGRADAPNFKPDQYYTDDYFSGGHADGYADYRGAEPILRHEFARTVEFIRAYRPSGRLLEIGCAYGFFLEEARPFYDVSGIEPAEDAADYCRRRGLRVLTGVADEPALAQLGGMDVIVLLDVIEHLPDPQATLTLCRRHLNAGGIIVITTGDFASLCARLAGSHWRLMTPPQHLWYHTPESMRQFGRALGLRLEACDHPWKLVPLSLIVFQLRRMLGQRQPRAQRGSQIGIPINMFDAMRCVFRKLEA
jgi:2-polyprenyl-3-methyl-5-hydroxy-6-metoxy-1,4-benzoquinol methylase